MNLVKKIGAGILVGTTALTTVVPVLAEQTSKVDMHAWAYEDLYQGSYFGILEETWLEDLQGTVSGKELVELVDALGEKFATIPGVTAKDEPTALATTVSGATRQQVLNAIFDELNAYNYPQSLGLENADMIAFMQKNGILKGDAKGLHLEQACTKEGAMAFAMRTVQYVFDTLDAGGKGFFWKAEKDDNEVYLLGSIHLASTDIYPFSQEIRNAYNEAEGIYVEANIFDMAGMQKFLDYAEYQDGTTLKDHLPEDLYNKAVEAAKVCGLSEEQMKYYKPWYLTNYFTVMNGTGSEGLENAQEASAVGIDNYFILDALTFGKPLYELEGYEYQAKLFDSYSEGLQQYLLEENIATLMADTEVNEVQDSVENWLGNWRDGDLESFAESYNLSNDLVEANEIENKYVEEYRDKLLVKRT